MAAQWASAGKDLFALASFLLPFGMADVAMVNSFRWLGEFSILFLNNQRVVYATQGTSSFEMKANASAALGSVWWHRQNPRSRLLVCSETPSC